MKMTTLDNEYIIRFGYVIAASLAGQDPKQVYGLHIINITISAVDGEQVSNNGWRGETEIRCCYQSRTLEGEL